MDDALCPDRSLVYPLHKKLFSFKRKGASNALFKTSGPAFGVHVRYHGKKLSTLETCLVLFTYCFSPMAFASIWNLRQTHHMTSRFEISVYHPEHCSYYEIVECTSLKFYLYTACWNRRWTWRHDIRQDDLYFHNSHVAKNLVRFQLYHRRSPA